VHILIFLKAVATAFKHYKAIALANFVLTVQIYLWKTPTASRFTVMQECGDERSKIE
jgi:hypothetical protein